jgi:hypothetical protein
MVVVLRGPAQQAQKAGVKDRFPIEDLEDGFQAIGGYFRGAGTLQDNPHEPLPAEGYPHAGTRLDRSATEGREVVERPSQGHVQGDAKDLGSSHALFRIK